MSAQEFGEGILQRAKALGDDGKDANQTAKILCDADAEGHNYGIGIVLNDDGNPLETSATILDFAAREVEASTLGNYYNSAAIMSDLKSAVLRWQRVPEEYWDRFVLALPSDAGTGAVLSAVEIALAIDNTLAEVGVEELGWPAYGAIAKTCRVGIRECPTDCVISDAGVLPLYQAGPMNTTGRVTSEEVLASRAEAARDRVIILDRAYSGFEFARNLDSDGYDTVMRRSYEKQLAPFLAGNQPVLIALSPTKCFRSFALRPAGMLLAYVPDAATRKEVTGIAGYLMRARGCSFEHPVSRGFAKAMVSALDKLEGEHAEALTRCATTEAAWGVLARGTEIETLFSDQYSGLFRNPPAREGAEVALYGEHIYPVFSSGRCRINVTGLPGNEALQGTHVAAFARACKAE
jgi:hypothetical protein